jgi:osmotically-inducible protein OsmY
MDPGPYMLLLALCGQFAAEPPSQTDVRDVELTVYARRALLQDDVLGNLNLGVRVEYGVATLWGAAPSREAGARAVQVLKTVRGIYQVRDELSYRNTGTDEAVRKLLSGLAESNGPLDLAPWLPSTHKAPTGSLSPALSRVPGETDRAEVLSARTDAVEREERKEATWPPRPVIALLAPIDAPSPPSLPAAAHARPITLLAPQLDSPVAPRASTEAAPVLTSLSVLTPTDLHERVEQLRAADSRFRRIQFAVADGVVVLRGQVSSVDDLMDFARGVARLPYVRQVDIRPVKVGN